MKKYILTFGLIALSLLIISCSSAEVTGGNMLEKIGFFKYLGHYLPSSQGEEPVNTDFTIYAKEGELVRLDPTALDPDGDFVTYYFTKPFDDAGRWQTVLGDEGSYLTVITASDGKANVTALVEIIITRANRPPVIDCDESIKVDEGTTIDMNNYCRVFDIDGDKFTFEYGGWTDSAVKEIGYNEAGTHYVNVKANDGKDNSSSTAKVVVFDVNRPPVFQDLPELISVFEGDKVIVVPYVTDEDGDDIKITFGHPLDSNGEWQTKIGDAGRYDASVLATDGTEAVVRTVVIEVKQRNTAPVLKFINDVEVYEGETVTIDVDAYDREDDRLKITVSGWMTSLTKETDYDDAGEYTVRVTVSDGQEETSQIVHVKVIDRNRPPYFVKPA